MPVYPVNKRKYRLGLLLWGVLAVSGLRAQEPVEDPGYARLLDHLLSHSVPEIGVAEANGLEGAVFLDARSGEEYAVSHIRHALWVGYSEFNPDRVRHLPKDKPVVVYCSVGYRSEKIAEQLREAGFLRVYNLYGGLFEWVNRGLPVVDRNGPTGRIHAYNRLWGRWVTQGQKVY